MNNSLNKNQTELPEQETQRAKREMKRVTQELFVEKVMQYMEEQRKIRKEKYRDFTQKYVAEKAGISLSTYKNYVSGRSHNVNLITAKMIAELIECRLSDVIEKAER